MKLINTNGMAFIGPGSEWFWAAFSAIALAITFIAIYRQLRLQRDGAAIEQMNSVMGEWSSERLARAKLALLLALEAGSPRIERSDRAVSTVAFFWSRVGYLVRKGHMDLGLVCEELGDQIQWWYEQLGPWEDPGPWQHFVWLAGAAATFDAKRGITRTTPDAASLARALPGMIEHFRQAVEYEEALRTVPVRFVATPVPVMGVRPERQPGPDDGLIEGVA